MSSNSIVDEHRDGAPSLIRCAVVTLSDTRTLETDTSGLEIMKLLQQKQYLCVERKLIPDDPERLGPLLESLARQSNINAILLTGGTGISPRDQTYECILGLLDRVIPGFGELFRMLSYEEIGSASLLSRAIGGLIGTTVVLSMPGSRGAVQLAMTKIILPELGHLVREAGKGLTSGGSQ